MKNFIPLGTPVIFGEHCEPGYTKENERVIFKKKLDTDKIGVIVGGTFIVEGKGVRSSSAYDDYSPGYIYDIKKVFVYLVRLGFTNKALKVLPKDISAHYPFNDYYPAPWLCAERYKWTEKDKECQRDIMKSVPRDSKGRWLK